MVVLLDLDGLPDALNFVPYLLSLFLGAKLWPPVLVLDDEYVWAQCKRWLKFSLKIKQNKCKCTHLVYGFLWRCDFGTISRFVTTRVFVFVRRRWGICNNWRTSGDYKWSGSERLFYVFAICKLKCCKIHEQINLWLRKIL